MTVDPAKLHLTHYPAAILRIKAKPIEDINDEVRAVADRMIDLMHAEEGVGLAAPQVGLPWRMFVTDVVDDGGPRVYVNPTVTLLAGPRGVHEEGCLSLPGIRVDIERPNSASISAMGLDGQPINRISDSFVTRVWQHEFDHLNGVMIIDKMSTLDRLATRRILKELEAAARPVKF